MNFVTYYKSDYSAQNYLIKKTTTKMTTQVEMEIETNFESRFALTRFANNLIEFTEFERVALSYTQEELEMVGDNKKELIEDIQRTADERI